MACLLSDACKESPLTNDSRATEKSKSFEVKEEALEVEATASSLEMQRQRFRQFGFQEVRGPREACNHLWELCRLWLRPERHSKEQMLELVVLEQFLAVLPSEVQGWVRGIGPEHCSQAVVLAEDFLRRHQEDEGQAGQELGPFKKEWDSFPNTEEASLNSGQRSILGEIKQEEKEDRVVASAGDERMYGMDPDNSGVAEPHRVTWNISHSDDLEKAWESRLEKGRLSSGLQVSAGVGVQPRIQYKRLIKCPECGKGFLWRSELIRHQMFHTGEKPYLCPDCGKGFSVKWFLVIHQRIHTGEKPYKCSACDKRFGTKGNLKRHQKMHIRKDKGQGGLALGSLKEEQDSFPNTEEASSDSWQRVILGEIKQEEKEDRVTASMGDNQTYVMEPDNSGIAEPHRAAWNVSHSPDSGEASESHLEKGKLSCNPQDTAGVRVQPRIQDERLKKCPECGKGFMWRSELIEHQRTHTGEKPYPCSFCGKSFSCKSYIIKHERIHTGEKPYICSHCSKGFISKSDLIKHERTHTGEKPYLCPDCGRSFSQKQFLVIHRRTHTGEKPYKCSECDKSFSQRTCLVIHERAHTGEKPFQCLVCRKSFGRRDILMTHQKVHTKEKPFQCLMCGKSFGRRDILKAHQKVHTQEKAFQCTD